MLTVPPLPPRLPPNPYRKKVTILSLLLNVAFFFFFWIFYDALFRIGPGGFEYVRPTDVTAWVLLPIFSLSTFLLGLNTLYQLSIKKTGEVYFLPVFLVNIIQFIASFAIVTFIVNALTCLAPNLLGMSIC